MLFCVFYTRPGARAQAETLNTRTQIRVDLFSDLFSPRSSCELVGVSMLTLCAYGENIDRR